MSWKAASYVKELGKDRVTVYEKLLLFVLADYHNTVKEVAWPSIPTLAEEALMSDRNVYVLLGDLERKGILKRCVLQGIGNAYQFVELDCGKPIGKHTGKAVKTPANYAGDRKSPPANTPARTPANGVVAIRKEPVEPVLEPVNTERQCKWNRCDGSGWRNSISRPGVKVICECQDPDVEAETNSQEMQRLWK